MVIIASPTLLYIVASVYMQVIILVVYLQSVAHRSRSSTEESGGSESSLFGEGIKKPHLTSATVLRYLAVCYCTVVRYHY